MPTLPPPVGAIVATVEAFPGRQEDDGMLGSELAFHFLNVMPVTVLLAPLVLWRHLRAAS